MQLLNLKYLKLNLAVIKFVTVKLIKMTITHKLIQPKMGLLKLAEKLGNVSEACKLGSAEEQLTRNSLNGGNDKAAEQNQRLLTSNHFYRKYLKKI